MVYYLKKTSSCEFSINGHICLKSNADAFILLGLNGDDIVRTLQYRVVKHPLYSTKRPTTTHFIIDKWN